MITQGPFTLTLGETLPLNDPGATSNNPATAVQIQNASPFIIEVNSGGIVLTIQSFTAQTVLTSGGGQQMSVTPISASTSTSVAAKSLTVVWLLANESAPIVDGPLTASALVSGLASAGLGGADVVVAFLALAAGAHGFFTGLGSANIQIWNWGYLPDSALTGTWPTSGGAFISVGASNQAYDSVGLEGSSNRLAGLNCAPDVAVFNYTSAGLQFFLDYSVSA